MTKQEFWRAMAESIYSCKYCPAKPDKNNKCCKGCGCAKSLQEFYERLEREGNDS